MRIVYFTESLLPLVDGVSLTLGHLFRDLERRGIEFRVYAPFVPPPDLPWSHRARRLPWVPFPLRTSYRVSLPWGRGLGRELEAWEPDLVHVASPTLTGYWARRFAARRGLPVVGTFHTDFVSYFRYYRLRPLEPLGWWMLRRFYGRCDVVVTPSTAMVEKLGRRGIGTARLWGRGVDTRLFSPHRRDPVLRRQLGADDHTPLLLMVSRLVREKDLLDLPPMVRRLEALGHRFRLALVGDGPLRKELEASLPGAVFAGRREGLELARWYASADLFVFPSTTETFGNVVQEALASGVPAVVVDRGGPRTVVEPGSTGLVARARDPSDLADRVASLLEDPARRRLMGRAAREQAEGRTWTRVNDRLIGHYHEVLQTTPPRPRARRDVA